MAFLEKTRKKWRSKPVVSGHVRKLLREKREVDRKIFAIKRKLKYTPKMRVLPDDVADELSKLYRARDRIVLKLEQETG